MPSPITQQSHVNTNVRYYMCLRNKPKWARERGVERCPLPAVPAASLERLAWEEVVATLLDPDKLRTGLAAARAEYAEANGRRAEQLATLEREMAKLRGRLSRILEEQLDAPSGSEIARLYRDKARQIELQLEHLQADHAQRAAEPHVGLSAEQAMSLQQFAAEVRAGIDAAEGTDRQRVFELLRLQGRLRLDDERGIRLAKRNRFSIEWTAIVPLRNKGREFTNIQTIWVGPAGSVADTKNVSEE